MKDIEDKLAAFLMDYGVLKNADAEKMAKRIAGMFAAERDQLAAKCAEMRTTIEMLDRIVRGTIGLTNEQRRLVTLSLDADCGKGWLSPEKVQRLREALEHISEMECLAEHPDNCECCLVESDAVEIAKQALDETK